LQLTHADATWALVRRVGFWGNARPAAPGGEFPYVGCENVGTDGCDVTGPLSEGGKREEKLSVTGNGCRAILSPGLEITRWNAGS
jgi:hypothetical protein